MNIEETKKFLKSKKKKSKLVRNSKGDIEIHGNTAMTDSEYDKKKRDLEDNEWAASIKKTTETVNNEKLPKDYRDKMEKILKRKRSLFKDRKK